MVIAADFSGLHAWAQAMSVILLLELIVLLIVIAALTLLLMLGARWLQMHVVPVLNATVPRAKQALDITNQGTDRVVRGVAQVHGWRSALEAGVRTFFQGPEVAANTQEPPLPATNAAASITGAAPATPTAGGEQRRDERARYGDEHPLPPAAQAG